MRVDFYQLSQTPVEQALPLIARKVLDTGERLLVVAADEGQRARISDALWAAKTGFLAHGLADAPHAERQPILLSAGMDAPNGARMVALADGEWRDGADAFARVLLFFDQSTVERAREIWRMLDGRKGQERNYWRQEDGKWVQAA